MYNEKLEKALVKYKEAEKFQKLGGGMKYLLSSYYRSKDKSNISNKLIIDDIIWDCDLEDFTEALKKYNIEELIFASTWSSAIEVLIYLIENGYQVTGSTIYKDETLFGKREVKKGLLLTKE